MTQHPSVAALCGSLRQVRSSLTSAAATPDLAPLLEECRFLLSAAGGTVVVAPEVLSRVLRHCDETRSLLAPFLEGPPAAKMQQQQPSSESAQLMSLPAEILTHVASKCDARRLGCG